jgi:hypothetical protein
MMTSKGVEVDPHNGYESPSARGPKPARARCQCAHRDELVHHVPQRLTLLVGLNRLDTD